MNSHFDSNADKVIANVVDDAQRLSFLPRHFGNAIYATRFHQLREFALDHPHADAILEAID